jgi:hypothetical protein
MAKWTALCWQEIPSVIEASDDDGTHKVQLSTRFQELIDMIAMRRKLAGTDAYLMEWRKEPTQERDGSATEVAEAVSAEIEARYEDIKAEAIRLSETQG